jgi:hypothetical protein
LICGVWEASYASILAESLRTLATIVTLEATWQGTTAEHFSSFLGSLRPSDSYLFNVSLLYSWNTVLLPVKATQQATFTCEQGYITLAAFCLMFFDMEAKGKSTTSLLREKK